MDNHAYESIVVASASPEQFPRLARLWLEASLQAHPFVDAAYWTANEQAMREKYLPASEVRVCLENGVIAGFVATVGDCVAALFVDPEHQGKGYGGLLLDHVKSGRETLSLNVFSENEKASAFYRKHGFKVEKEQVDEATGAREQAMIWRQDAGRA